MNQLLEVDLLDIALTYIIFMLNAFYGMRMVKYRVKIKSVDS